MSHTIAAQGDPLEGPELQARGGRAVARREDLYASVQKLIDLV